MFGSRKAELMSPQGLRGPDTRMNMGKVWNLKVVARSCVFEAGGGESDANGDAVDTRVSSNLDPGSSQGLITWTKTIC